MLIVMMAKSSLFEYFVNIIVFGISAVADPGFGQGGAKNFFSEILPT